MKSLIGHIYDDAFDLRTGHPASFVPEFCGQLCCDRASIMVRME